MLLETANDSELTEFLSQFMTEHKRALFDRVVRERTRHLTIVLENLFHSQNASACLRSCDCFGIQDVHIIEGRHQFRVNRDVALGGAQWLDLHRYADGDGEQNTETCVAALKQRGYRILAAAPDLDGTSLHDVDVEQKTALLFGGELEGLSETATDLADGLVRIPMYGFTESFNVSVAVALCLYELTSRLRRLHVNWRLSDEEIKELRAAWIRLVLGETLPYLERRFHQERQSR